MNHFRQIRRLARRSRCVIEECLEKNPPAAPADTELGDRAEAFRAHGDPERRATKKSGVKWFARRRVRGGDARRAEVGDPEK
jgi:hypothetical protein